MVSLLDLLAVDALDLRVVVVGDGHVRWVATSELEDPTPFLEGGEVLLTTGLNTKGWRSQWGPYVRRLRLTGVTAIGLGTGLTHRAPPTGLVAACRAEGMPLFEVPAATSFVSISRAAVTLLERAEQALARRVVVAQHDLTAAALGQNPEVEVVTTLARLVGGVTAVFDPDGSIRLGPPGEGSIDVPRVAEEIARIRHLGVRAASGFSDPQSSTSVQPIGARGQPRGYLVVASAGRPDEADRAAATSALSLLSLVAEWGREQQTQARALGRRAWALLVDGNRAGAAALLDHAGRPLPARLQAVVVDGDPEMVLELAEARRVFTVAAPLEAGLGLAFGGSVPQGFLGELERSGWRAGVGAVVEPSDFARAEATALRSLAATTQAEPVIDWATLANRGVVGLVGADAGAEFARDLLSPLDEEQRRTLLAFVENHGSRVATAEALGVHRNTVRGRLEAVETLWGRSLDDVSTRVDAWVALQLTDGGVIPAGK